MTLPTERKPMETSINRSPWNILLVEDDPDDYFLVREMLSTGTGQKFKLTWADNYTAARAKLDCASMVYDAVLVDYELGRMNGLELIHEMVEAGCRAPIILLTGQGSYELDVEAMRAGAVDYLDKGQVNGPLLERAIRYAIEHRQAEEDLKRANDELESRVRERTCELQQANQELQAEITERKRTQAELAEMKSRLIDSAEAERLKLAQELHDGSMQELYALTYQFEMMRDEMPDHERQSQIGSAVAALNEVIQVLRSTASELRPPALASFGLKKAIESHCETFRLAQPSLDISLDLDDDGQQLHERVRIALFRIYQVTLTNVIRHAYATRVDVRLKLQPGSVVLEVQDNGRGFNLPERWVDLARQGHLGLVGALERAEAAGGSLDVESSPGHGTHVRVTIPM